MCPCLVTNSSELVHLQRELEALQAGEFDVGNEDDHRERVWVSIARRRAAKYSCESLRRATYVVR
jgi:beta-xylosidase